MKRVFVAALMGLALSAGCGSSPVAGDPEITVQFFRKCSPYRGRLEVTVAEAGGQAGITVTSVTLRMIDINGIEQFTRAMTAADVTAALGTNQIDPALSRTLVEEAGYPGDVDTMDSTARVDVSIQDDAGNTFVKTVHAGFQRDGCQ